MLCEKISDAYPCKLIFCGWKLKYSISTYTQNTTPVSATAQCPMPMLMSNRRFDWLIQYNHSCLLGRIDTNYVLNNFV